jgi:hypothetical protein
MSAIVSAVKSVVEGAVKAVETVGKVVVSTVEKVGNVVNSVVDAVGKAVDAIKDIARPLLENYAVQAALMAAGVPPVYAAPMAAASTTLARGGTPEDALKSAAIVSSGQYVQNQVYQAAIRNGFDPTQAAAAASAATSASATIIAGGDLEDALKAGAIGATSSYASSEVLRVTKNQELANFTRVATAGALQGQSIEQAILNGATMTAVNFAREYFEQSNRITQEAAKIENERNRVVQRYNEVYREYSSLVDQYNEYARTGIDPSRKHFDPNSTYANTNNFSLDWYKQSIDNRLSEIYALSDEIGGYNQQINQLYQPLQGILDKANAEGLDLGSMENYAEAQVETQEQQLLRQIQQASTALESYSPEYIAALERGQVASLDGPLRIDISGVPKTLYESPDGSLMINEFLQVFENGEPTLRLTPEEYDTFALEYDLPPRPEAIGGGGGAELPLRGLIDLREATGGQASGVAVIVPAGGAVGEGEGGGGAGYQPVQDADISLSMPFAIIGRDTQGNDKVALGDQTFTLITIGNQKVLKNDAANVYYLPEMGPTENKPLKLTPVDVQVNEQNDPVVVPKQQPSIGGSQGGAPSEQVFQRVVSPAAQIDRQIQQQQAQIQGLMLQQQIYLDQVAQAQQERQRVASQRQQLEAALPSAFTPASREEAQQTIAQLQQLEQQFNLAEQQLSQEAENLNTQIRDAEVAVREAEKASQEQQKEVERFLQERQKLVTTAQERRYQEQLEQFDRDLARLESEISGATTEAERAGAQRSFIEAQKKRLAETGRLSGALQQKLDQELRNYINEYERAFGAATTAQREREGLTRPAEPGADSRGITDSDIMRLLGLSKEEAERFGFATAGAEEGAPVEGEGEGGGEAGVGGGGEGEGVGTGEGEGLGAGTGEGGRPDTGVMSTVRIAPSREKPAEGVSTRVTGQGLVGILGERDPLFGGDPGEQQDVWNIRSLRLRKALGL